jgi:hypothetical protein
MCLEIIEVFLWHLLGLSCGFVGVFLWEPLSDFLQLFLDGSKTSGSCWVVDSLTLPGAARFWSNMTFETSIFSITNLPKSK